MPQQDKPQPFLPIDVKYATNLVYHLVLIHALCILPFIRKGVGKRYLGIHGFFAWMLILGYGGLVGAPEMLVYFWFWLGFAIYRRMTYDPKQLVQYLGWPILTDWWIGNEMTARLAEAGMVWIIGRMLCDVSPAVGQFVTFGGYSLGLKWLIDSAIVERQMEAAEDGKIMMEIYQERMKRGR